MRGQNTTIDFLQTLGGGKAGAVQGEASANARTNAESQEAAMNGYGPSGGGVGGQSIYSTTGTGLMGSSFDINLRDPGGYTDPRVQANRDALAGRVGAVSGVQNHQMQSAQSLGANVDPAFRNQQLQLGNMLMAQANGTGPSVAGAQLRQSTQMNLQAALAQAASSRGGNLGAAQYALGNARANIQQQAAQQLAQNRMQEQMNAQSMLGGVTQAGRAGDQGIAELGQQNNQFNAGQIQAANGSNMNANIQQDQYRQSTLNQLLAMGMSYDQANAQADLQARQFGADLFNRSQLGVNGQNMQASGQTMQLVGGMVGAAGGAAGQMAGMMGGGGGGGGSPYQPTEGGGFTGNGVRVSPNM